MELAPLRILITGGTFDKDYLELEGRLHFRETHVPEMLRLGRSHLPVVVQDQPIQSTAASLGDGDSLHHQRDLTERSVIQRALITNGYSRTRAADALGISRVTLYKKMKKYGLMKQSPTPAM